MFFARFIWRLRGWIITELQGVCEDVERKRRRECIKVIEGICLNFLILSYLPKSKKSKKSSIVSSHRHRLHPDCRRRNSGRGSRPQWGRRGRAPRRKLEWESCQRKAMGKMYHVSGSLGWVGLRCVGLAGGTGCSPSPAGQPPELPHHRQYQ